MFGRKQIAMLVAEFLGTSVLTLAVLSIRYSTVGSAPYFVALGAGLTVALLLFVFGTTSGAQLNPAVTIALWTARKIQTVPAAFYIVFQLLGAWAAYGVFRYFAGTGLQAIGGHYLTRVLVAEAVGAFIFVFAWSAVVAQRYANGALAASIGLAFAVAILVASSVPYIKSLPIAIGLVNPAIALGMHAWDIWGSMGWGTYVLGPVAGGVVAANLYEVVFAGADRVVSSAKVAPVVRKTTTKKTAKRTAKRR